MEEIENKVVIEPIISVEITVSKMEAYLTIINAVRAITKNEVMNALAVQGVFYGILDQAIEKEITSPTGTRILIANGTNPVHGNDAYIEFKCLPQNTGNKPSELDDGRVDFYNLDLIRNVKNGEVLAIKTPVTPEQAGCTVTGQPIPAMVGRDKHLVPGKNVELSSDKNVAVATIDGHAVVVGNKINVTNVYTVKGDVDFSTGNITYNGSVIVKGDVSAGFTVIAEGDIEILGLVFDGTVKCGGNLKVSKGITGTNTLVKTGGSVYTKFLENATVYADNDVIVAEAILHAHVYSKGSVIVGGKGSIIGGIVKASTQIKCKSAGSFKATAELEAGVNPELRQSWINMCQEKNSKALNLDKVEKAVSTLTQLKLRTSNMHPDKLALLVQVTKLQTQLLRELEELNINIQEAEEQIQRSNQGKILVQDTLFSGVKVTLGQANFTVQENMKFVCIRNENDEIIISPYK